MTTVVELRKPLGGWKSHRKRGGRSEGGGWKRLCEPGSKLLVLGMVIQPSIGNPYNGYINPYYWVDDHPLLYGNNGSLGPSTCIFTSQVFQIPPEVRCFRYVFGVQIPSHQVFESLGTYTPPQKVTNIL